MSPVPVGVESISMREFARRDGCDPKLVRDAVKDGSLVKLSDEKLDAALVGTGWRYRNRHKAGTGGAPTPHKKTSVPGEISAAEILATALGLGGISAESSEAGFIHDVLGGKFAHIGLAETVKENALALKHLLDGRQRAAALVERETAEAVLFETFRAVRDAWLNWPVRVGPLLAADLGLDAQKVTEALIPYVQQQLEALGEPDADFTERS